MTHEKSPRTGGVRFAPSPTGRFHVGNLRTAWVSYQWSKALGVPWVVRVEDIDGPRVLLGAQEQQLEDMAKLGLRPDVVLVQSHFHERHWQAFCDAVRSGQVYACDCSRKEVQTALAGIASAPHTAPPIYSGRCRTLACDREMHAAESLAWRFRMPDESGRDDVIIARSAPIRTGEMLPATESFVPAYHWACAIDDFDGGYDLLVRSVDLLPAITPQRAIQNWLSQIEGLQTPRLAAVYHTSLVTQNDGHRLEKRTRGVTLPELEAAGLSPLELIELFERSFDRIALKSRVENGELRRETADTLSLEALNLTVS